MFNLGSNVQSSTWDNVDAFGLAGNPTGAATEWSMRWVFYRDKKNQWHWKRKATNGRVIEASESPFESLEKAKADASEIGWTEESQFAVHAGHLQSDHS